ncbi:MAG TPA: heparan-alpha-glucosaminide N-acetyltransferase domain-containing protein [Terriglobales bacterium]|nr:heparan-alpha-glucosaminide N-acetyltransferase domain-containing protein [Terriglobales bacterium]
MSSTLSSQAVGVAGAPAPTTSGAVAGIGAGRIVSLDIMRGLVMVIMALDHTRDFFTNLRFEPERLAQTYYALFFTRWITHFCAPLFFFLAGTGAFFYGRRRTPQALTRFLWTRGLWLIVIEFTVVGTAWTFLFPWGFFGVIWALGACMVLMAAIVRLPLRWIAVFSGVLILGHDLLDPVRPKQFGVFAPLWTILHVRGGVSLPFNVREFVPFPLVPWVAVMAAGYVFGSIYLLEKERRQKLIAQIGLGLTIAFVLLRLTNLYGNPPVGLGGVSQGPWHIQPTVEKTVILFFDVEKYPPSLQYLLMTLGPSLLLLAWLDKKLDQKDAGRRIPPALSPLLTFGRVPLFFYILHLYLIHSLAVLAGLLSHQPVAWLFHGGFMFGAPDEWGFNLPFVYLMWITAVVILYFPCRWYEGVKQRRKDWWLSYI